MFVREEGAGEARSGVGRGKEKNSSLSQFCFFFSPPKEKDQNQQERGSAKESCFPVFPMCNHRGFLSDAVALPHRRGSRSHTTDFLIPRFEGWTSCERTFSAVDRRHGFCFQRWEPGPGSGSGRGRERSWGGVIRKLTQKRFRVHEKLFPTPSPKPPSPDDPPFDLI